MQVPLLDVGRQNAPIEEELHAAAARVLSSGHYILGPEVERFEEACAAAAGVRFAVGLSSGTDAILVALMAFGIGPGDEVICPSYTFFATAGCVARVGATPVFVDSCAASFNLDTSRLEQLITPRTKALLPVHLFGQPADMDEIMTVARRHGLRVIEDMAQAFGAEYHGCPVGSIGDCGTVSFYPSKNLGGFGDAGLLLTSDPEIASRVRLLRNHGAERQYFHRTVGGNFRLDALQAALLSVKLPLLSRYTAARQHLAAEYDDALAALPGIILPARQPGRTHIMNQYTIRVPGRRDALRSFLLERGIATAIYYPMPLHRQECFRRFDDRRELPVADALAAEALSLPVFPELRPEEQAAVIGAMSDFCRRRPANE